MKVDDLKVKIEVDDPADSLTPMPVKVMRGVGGLLWTLALCACLLKCCGVI